MARVVTATDPPEEDLVFERYALAHRPTRKPLVGLFAAGSVVAHAAVVAGLLLSAMWQIDKLRLEDTPVMVSAAGGSPSLPAGEPAAVKRLVKPRKRLVEVLTQSAPPTDDQATASTGPAGDGVQGGGPGGQIGALPCTAGDCTGLEIIGTPMPRRAATAAAPRIVRPALIEGQRIRGNPQIGAPEAVKLAMRRALEAKVQGTVKMCLDRTGAVSSLGVVSSTGYPAYDRRLVDEMQAWLYSPYRLDSGEAVPVCTNITFVLRME